MEPPNLADLKHEVAGRWLDAMYAGDFTAAWQQTDRLEAWRGRIGGDQNEHGFLRWSGRALQDRTVLIRCLHGLGDTLQFVRYLPLLRRQARQTILYAQPALLPLLRTTSALGKIENGWSDETPEYDEEIEIMELPYIFRSTTKTLPRAVPYLDLKKIQDVEFSLPDVKGKNNIGLVWAASQWNRSRSVPLSSLCFPRTLSVRYFSLQQECSAEEITSATFSLVDLSARTAEPLDAAAALLQLELLITVDTFIAHLAGALGCRVWLLLQHQADWRWQKEMTHSPWYPTFRLFRQPAPGDWTAVGRQVAAALTEEFL